MHGALMIVGLAGPDLTPAEVAWVKAWQPVGFFLDARNLVSPDQARQLTDSLRRLSQRQPLVAVNSDDRQVLQTLFPSVPAAAELARLADSKAIGTAGMLTGELLRMIGVNFCFGPTLDLADQAGDVSGVREQRWGDDPQRVIDHAGQWNRWLRKRGIASCAKSFPGGGRAVAGPGNGLPSVSTTLEALLRKDLLPYTALMPELDAIQVGHVAFPQLDADWPASLSPQVIRRLLRDQLGFDHHLVVPDDLTQLPVSSRYGLAQAAFQALLAGNDLVRIGHEPAAIQEVAAAIAKLPQPVQADAWDRVERIRDKLHWPPPWNAAKFAETNVS